MANQVRPARAPAAQAPEWRVTPGLTDYAEAVRAMESRVEAIRAVQAGELVWLVEHPPVYTAGTSADPAEMLDARGIPVHRTGRGGRFTYHGPGQRVVYAMLDLRRRGQDVRGFVRGLEEWAILTLARVGVKGERRQGRVGIWVAREDAGGNGNEDKIAAIGVRVRGWVTFHGLAINVDPDLSAFAGIVPCGVTGPHFGVTSLKALGVNAAMREVDAALKETFARAFAR
ncbi:MAG: lipoyl(octanoyl) transferase LipB [Rhodospirillales bacterium]